MVATEIIVAIIGGGVALFVPIIGVIVNKCNKDKEMSTPSVTVPTPSAAALPLPFSIVPPHLTVPCQMAGISFNNIICSGSKTQCIQCNLWYCPYHLSRHTCASS